MKERRSARRYDISLPVVIRVPLEKEAPSRKGNVRNISTHGVYIVSDQDLIAGAEVDLKITLPAEITGTEVFIRAKGKIVRLEETSDGGSPQVGVAAVIELLEIIRNPRH